MPPIRPPMPLPKPKCAPPDIPLRVASVPSGALSFKRETYLHTSPCYKVLCYLYEVSHCNSEQIKCEDLQSFKWEGVPWTGDEGVAQVPDPVHAEGHDEDVDPAHIADNPVRVEQEGN